MKSCHHLAWKASRTPSDWSQVGLLLCKALKLCIHTADTMHTLEGICKWKQVHHMCISPNINNYTDSLSPHRFVSLGNHGSNTCWWRAVIGGNMKPLGSYIRWCTDVPPPTDVRLGQCMCHRASSQKKAFTAQLAVKVATRCCGLHVGAVTLTHPEHAQGTGGCLAAEHLFNFLCCSLEEGLCRLTVRCLQEVSYPSEEHF